MSTALYVGIRLDDHNFSVALLDEAESARSPRKPVVFPATALGLQSLRSFLMAYVENLHLAVAIAGHQALDVALKLGSLMSTQVFIIAESFSREPQALAEYARHVA